MKNINIEIKARTGNPDTIRAYLKERGAEFRGTDHQTDTYFNVPDGRLKIREGTIENCIVFYRRPDNAGPKRCDYIIETFTAGDPVLKSLKALLSGALGVLTVVDKKREIYFIGTVKFHIDNVAGLGSFFEIEAIGDESMSENDLRHQCEGFLKDIGIGDDDLVDTSYCDLVKPSSV